MKHPSLCLIIPTLLVSSLGVTVAQEHKWRPLLPVDTTEVWHSIPGVVPEHRMTYDPVVGDIIRETNLDSLVSYVRILSGEDSVAVGGARRLIRNRSTQEGSDLAADYLREKLESFNLEVHDQQYSSTGRNIYATQPGYLYPEQQYIICAHYDAVADYCADDNASGVAGVLEAARIFSKYDFKYTVVYALWDEEEGGLIGSNNFASQAASTGMQVQGVINLDMLGWDGNGDKLADIHTTNAGNSNDLASLLVIVNHLYQLSLKPVIYNPGTWQSDHSVFWNRGWGAVLLIEAYYGGDLNPYYHTSDDRVSKFSLPYFHDMSRLSLGALSTLAEVTTDTLLALVTPDYGYQTYVTMVQIRGANTHFQESSGTLTVWLSNGAATIPADSISVSNNRTLNAWFNLTADVALGLWDVHVQNSMDGILIKGGGFAVLPPPALITISPESLSVSVDKGTVGEYSMTIRNSGGSALNYTIANLANPEGLVAYYPFNGNANDESGNGYNANVQDADLATDRFAEMNRAFHFNGTSSIIKTPLRNRHAAWSLSAWISPSVVQNWPSGEHGGYGTGHTVINSDCAGVGGTGFGIDADEVRVIYDWRWVSFDYLFSPNNWYNVVVVYEPGNGRISAFVNGSLIDTVSVSIIPLPEYVNFVIGNIPTAGAWGVPFEGVIDDIRIYDRALNEREVLSNSLLPTNWLVAEPEIGAIAADSSTKINLSVDATKLNVGEYNVVLMIRCNDPFLPIAKIPMHIVVTPGTGIEQDATAIKVFALRQNYPNPFNPSTTIRFELPQASMVRLSVYDMLGREASVLVNERRDAGVHEVKLDGSNLASGVYCYRLQAGDFVQARKFVVLK